MKLREISKEHYEEMSDGFGAHQFSKGFLHYHPVIGPPDYGLRYQSFFAKDGKCYIGPLLTHAEYWSHIHSLA